MSGSINKVILVGNICQEPETRSMQSGDEVVNFSLATNESWKDKSTGERKEKAEFHRVVIFNQGLVNVAKNYLHKGSKVYIEGQLETRSWEKNGERVYTTEIVLRPYRGELTMLDKKEVNGAAASNGAAMPVQSPDSFGDEIPF